MIGQNLYQITKKNKKQKILNRIDSQYDLTKPKYIKPIIYLSSDKNTIKGFRGIEMNKFLVIFEIKFISNYCSLSPVSPKTFAFL